MKQVILLFYQYVQVEDPHALARWMRDLATRCSLKGRVIVAPEGVNATLAGDELATDTCKAELEAHPLLGGMDIKQSRCEGAAFSKLRVVVKPEIVRLGIDPAQLPFTQAAPHVTPHQAHELISSNSDLVILDARNDYESRMGAFKGALTPPITNFRELPGYLHDNKELFSGKDVLMYCTGGVRCERASAYLMSLGVARSVCQIQGGIDRYVEAFPQGHFKGRNYVFDGRISVPVTEDVLAPCDFGHDRGEQQYNCEYTRCNKRIIVCSDCSTASVKACSDACYQAMIAQPSCRRTKPTVTACPL